ncbi:pilus assembly protein CpaB [Nocardioides marmoriginsengisoli]|uniref:Pilus assembly protein CpaB n=1 Tax=Nocardioides marmoriginsengisoli TaxID=661483 RepID=A0A3N0CH97_9ACTN|nr:RcpC/CpaB family pilus assembly protein [Nocardioides marmoriginsengisoli]RNL62406.1 pilus assembly protein CpaB [Nocardioides marmoriginsengisoli]
MLTPAAVVARIHRSLLIHRRGLAALCLGLSCWLVLGEVRAGPARTVEVWTAAHDLPGGAALTADDLRRTKFLAETAPPAAALRAEQLVGRTLAAPLARGDVLTRADLVGSRRLDGYPGRSAVGLRIPDADAAALLRPDDHVDLVASDPQQRGAGSRDPETLVRDAIVLAVPRAASGPGAGDHPGRLVVFAVPSDDAAHVAATGATLFLTPIWNR